MPQSRAQDRGWVMGWCVIAGALAAWTAAVPLQRIPHVSDEVAYTLQSRLFAAGMRVGPGALEPSLHDYPFWNAAPVAYSPFPPGWPALLSLGEIAGLPWLMNPLLVMAFPALIWVIARAWGGASVARLAVAVAALSPAVWMMAGTRMAHTSTLVALGVVAAVAARRPDRSWVWALGGLAAAYTVVARPMDAAVVAGPLLAWGLLRAPGLGARAGWILLPAAGAALLLLDNQMLTGSAFQFPIDGWYEKWLPAPGRPGCNRLGFGAEVGCFPTFNSLGHTPLKALKIFGETSLRMDVSLLGVPGALLLAALGAWRLRPRWPWLIAAALVLAHALYWSPGRAYMARFWHPLLLLLPIAVAAALHTWPRRWVVLGLVGAALLGGSWRVPELADRYWCADRALEQTLADAGITEGVVFLRGKKSRQTSWPRMGVDVFVCDPMLESGDGFRLNDPSRPDEGLRIRHALHTLKQTRQYMAAVHPGAPAWLVVHKVDVDMYRVLPVKLE